jgi:hypothetical protein
MYTFGTAEMLSTADVEFGQLLTATINIDRYPFCCGKISIGSSV